MDIALNATGGRRIRRTRPAPVIVPAGGRDESGIMFPSTYIYYFYTRTIHHRSSGNDPDMITILYVDDEPVMLDTLKLFLERDPELRVMTALSANAALALLQNQSCDAIISDYEMPEIDGIAFLKIIREQYPRLPFIIFTGKGREEIVIESLNNGADYYVRKGGDPKAQFAELVSKVRHAVELRENQTKVARLGRLYIVLSRINEAIVRIHDWGTLEREVCTIAVQDGGFTRAWIGFEDPVTLEVSAVMASGTIDGFFTDVRESSEPLPAGKGLTIAAIRQGQPSFSNDILTDPGMETWAEEARKSGYRSAASFPIRSCRTSRGAMTFFSPYPGFFTDSETGLLSDLCEDISYALETIDLEASRRRVKDELEESRHRLACIINFLPEPVFAVDRAGVVTIWNRAMEALTGTGADKVIGRGNFEYSLYLLGERRPALLDLVFEPDTVLEQTGYTAVIRDRRTVRAEVVSRHLRSSERVLRLTASPLYDEKGQLAGAIESVQDITACKNAERELGRLQEKDTLVRERGSP